MSKKTLYICYFGLREPLVQTQVLPYLRELSIRGIEVHLLTFEPDKRGKWSSEAEAVMKQALWEQGIHWTALAYHKTPSIPATAFDILCGALHIWRLIRREKLDFLHARVHVPMLMAALARSCSSHKPKIIFDIRGFFPEEYVDAGLWRPNGLLYKLAKRVENWLLRQADGFVVLTEKARDILFPESSATGRDKQGRPVEVIPCCVDLQRFEIADGETRKKTRETLGIGDRTTVAYVGSFGGWYLTEEMLDFFSVARELEDAFILILTQRDKERIVQRLRERGMKEKDFLVESVTPSELPKFLSAADVAISFIKPCYSKLSSSPTKIAEYLACGIPIIANSGVGDIAEQITSDGVGVVINEFSLESYRKALRELNAMRKETDLAARCRESARKRFDLIEVGAVKYSSLYEKLLAERSDFVGISSVRG